MAEDTPTIRTGFEKLTSSQAAIKEGFEGIFPFDKIPKGGSLDDIEYLRKCIQFTHVETMKGMKKMMPDPDPEALGCNRVEYTPESDELLTCPVYVWSKDEGVPEGKKMMIYIHGGGMCFLEAKGSLETGPAMMASNMPDVVYAVIEFTNSKDEKFPRGLNDCVNAVKFLHKKYKPEGLLIHGESGGGNLTMTTMLKLKQEGQLDIVTCGYVECAYLHAMYPEEEIPEDIKASCDEYAVTGQEKENQKVFGPALLYLYTPKDGGDLQNPLAWPYYATVEDLKGLPPIFINSNECDILTSQAHRLFRMLQEAEVQCAHTVRMGTFHAGDAMDPLYMQICAMDRYLFLNTVMTNKATAEAAKKAEGAKEEEAEAAKTEE